MRRSIVFLDAVNRTNVQPNVNQRRENRPNVRIETNLIQEV